MSAPPRVFLSSTLYDLLQVRADIGSFVDALGYGLLDSTDPRFFADPQVDTVEACLREVRNSDMLILVIGGRYGSEVAGHTGSITNQEWELAHARGIPIFTFVERSVWESLRHWHNAPDGDYSAAVDDNRVFEFIQAVTGRQRNNWVRPFDKAGEIVEILRHQWATMFGRGLREQLDRDVIPVLPSRHALISEYVKHLSGAAVAIDLLGVSLMTVARSASIGQALTDAASRQIPIRVLTMSRDASGARDRGSEEYGEQELVDELSGAENVWRELAAGCDGFEVRHYRGRATMFYFRVDDARFVSFYPFRDTGSNAPTFAFSEVGDAALYFQARFDALWDAV